MQNNCECRSSSAPAVLAQRPGSRMDSNLHIPCQKYVSTAPRRKPTFNWFPRAVFSNALLAALNSRGVSHEGDSEQNASTFLDIYPSNFRSPTASASRDRKVREVRRLYTI